MVDFLNALPISSEIMVRPFFEPVGTEASNQITINVQAADMRGKPMQGQFGVAIRLSDACSIIDSTDGRGMVGAVTSSGALTAQTPAIGTLVEGSGGTTVRMLTNASGRCGLYATYDSGGGVLYAGIEPTFGSALIVGDHYAQMTFAA